VVERLRGRAGKAQRDRRLRRTKGLCEKCLEKGIVRPATIVDHVQPVAFGGADEDENTQNLCDECNLYKTAYDAAAQRGASFHPDWLKPSAIPLTIVAGPPCSGKTTYVATHASDGDLVIDLDTIQMTLNPSYRHWSQHEMDSSLLYRAIRVRNELLGSLSRRTTGRAWFIVSAPSKAERDWWNSKLGGDVILLHPGVNECKRRAIIRGTPLAQDGIDRWERNALRPWAPKQAKIRQTIGVDGWPVE
jgi:hypothetical protein